MPNIRKARCPHCSKVNTVDVEKELEKHREVVVKMVSRPDIEVPKSIRVGCVHCGKSFKINL